MSTQARPMSAVPILLSLDDLRLNLIGSLAVSADARRVYLGRLLSSNRDRLNLGVLSLDPAGKPAGELRLYADNANALRPAWRSGVHRIWVDSPRQKLYQASNSSDPTSALTNGELTVYDLDQQGDPVGPPRSFPFGDPNNPTKDLQAFVRHPRLAILYLVGLKEPKLYWYLSGPITSRTDS